jgi:hypothetical protein
MRKYLITFILLLLTCISYSYGEKVKDFGEFTDPSSIEFIGDRLYITDGVQIYMYQADNLKLIKKFGKEGEGPGEFIKQPGSSNHLYIGIEKNNMLVSCNHKVLLFTLNGDFISEKKTTKGTDYIPISGNRYIGKQRYMEDKKYGWSANIYDKDLKVTKTLGRKDSWFSPKGPVNIIDDMTIRTYVSDNNIIVAGVKIDIFDLNGKRKKTLDYKFEKIEVSGKHKKSVIDYYKNSNRLRPFYESIKDRVIFNKYFPVYKRATVAAKKIFVQTHKRIGDKIRFVIFDLNGVLLKKVMLPLVEQDVQRTYPNTFDSKYFYQLLENEEEETWELHRYKF